MLLGSNSIQKKIDCKQKYDDEKAALSGFFVG
jgi:hypothetical protein